MKNQLSLTLLILLLCANFAKGQKLEIDVHPKKNTAFYIKVNPAANSVSYFLAEDANDAKRRIGGKANSINLYIEWLNPLKYGLIWKDSLKVDPRDKIIGDYISVLAGQFGSGLTSLNSTGSSQILASAMAAAPAPKAGVAAIQIPVSLNSPKLNSLYIQLALSQDKFTGPEVTILDKFTAEVAKLDVANNVNYKGTLSTVFQALLEVSSQSQAVTELKTQKNAIKTFPTDFKNYDLLIKTVTTSSDLISFSDPSLTLLNGLFKSTMAEFISESKEKLAAAMTANEKLKPVIKLFEESLNNESNNNNAKGYFPVREIEFEDGKILHTGLTISENTYDANTLLLSSKASFFECTFVFRRYDPIKISISTGLFYATTSLQSYGVADKDGSLIVAKENIDRDKALTAAFLNITFDIFKSRYVAPIVQLGVDPTKKHPFLLFGGGLTFPSARFAITGGPLWTWEAKLNDLVLDGTVKSTAELEKDVSYEFKTKPKGLYIGLQYNF